MQEIGTLEGMLPGLFRQELTEAERRLLSSAPYGFMTLGGKSQDERERANDPAFADAAEGRWGSEREVRAGLIRWLCVDAKASKLIDPHGLVIFGARITGYLDLEHVTLSFPLSLIRCRIYSCSLFHMKAPMLQMTGCRTDGVNAIGVEIGGSVYLDGGFSSNGLVSLYGAKIDGDLSFDHGQFKAADVALDVSEGVVRGRVLLGEGFSSMGRVNLYGTRIGGDLDCRGGRLSHAGDTALDANTAVIQGTVLFREGFSSEGMLSLIGAQIAGDLNCSDGKFRNGRGQVLNAGQAAIGGSVILYGAFSSVGEVNLYGAQIGGNLECGGGRLSNVGGNALVVDSAVIKGAIYCTGGFWAKGLVSLIGVQVNLDLNCEGASFGNAGQIALNATQANIHGSVLMTHGSVLVTRSAPLSQGFRAEGSVVLYGVQVGGDLNAMDAHLTAPGREALVADGAVIKGGAFFTNDFRAEGEVRMVGAQITGDLDCGHGQFVNAGGMAIRADHVQVKGYASLGNGFSADGEVSLAGADIGRNLDCTDGSFTFKGKDEHALNLEGAEVGGTVMLRSSSAVTGQMPSAGRRFSVEGRVFLLGAKVGGDLDCAGGSFRNPEGEALNAERTEIKLAVFFNLGFSAVGEVNLQGAHVGGSMDCSEGRFDGLKLEEATIKQTLYLLNVRGLGDLDLEDATAGDLSADRKSWPAKDHLLLDGFVYGGLSQDLKEDGAWRLQWLGRSKDFAAQPYRQMAKMLRDLGDDDGAKEVLMALEGRARGESRRRLGWARRVRRQATDGVSKATVGFGIYPELAVWELVGLAAVGWIVYRRAQVAGAMAPTEKTAYDEFRKTGVAPAGYPPFQPLVYSVENCVPLVKLGQDEKWQADPDAAGRIGAAPAIGRWAGWRRRMLLVVPERVVAPGSLRWLRWAMILLGWVLATFFVAGLTGSIRTG